MHHHGADPSQHIYLNTHALGQPLCVIFGAYDVMLQNGKKWCKLALVLVACTMRLEHIEGGLTTQVRVTKKGTL